MIESRSHTFIKNLQKRAPGHSITGPAIWEALRSIMVELTTHPYTADDIEAERASATERALSGAGCFACDGKGTASVFDVSVGRNVLRSCAFCAGGSL